MRLARASRAVAKVRVLTHDRRSGKQLYPAKQQGHPAVRAEFHCLCAAARCRVPLFVGPEVFASRLSLRTDNKILAALAAIGSGLAHVSDWPLPEIENTAGSRAGRVVDDQRPSLG